MENTNRGMHGGSLPMLSPLGAIEQEAPAFRHGVHHMGQTVLVNLPASSVTIADAGGYLSANTAEEAIQEICEDMSTARGELDALLAPSLRQYAILPSFLA